MQEIPDFLLKLSKDMNESPKRSTSHPFWQVRHKKLIPTQQGHDDVCFVIYDSEECEEAFNSRDDDESVFFEYIKDRDIKIDQECIDIECPEDMNLPHEFNVVYLQEVEEIVWTGLSEADAKAFIKRKQHDYPKLYTYVESAYWSPAFKELMEWIKGLSK